jgi:general secretion pathway protein G
VIRARRRAGFTLIELVVIILVLGIVASVAIPKFGQLAESAKVNATKDEMGRLKAAIIGATGPDGIPRGGYEIDVGFVPNQLPDLVAKPDSVSAWDKFIGRGWNGPYIDSAGGAYLTDAWDSTYQYNVGARTITSIGSGSSIVLSF